MRLRRREQEELRQEQVPVLRELLLQVLARDRLLALEREFLERLPERVHLREGHRVMFLRQEVLR